MVTQEFTVLDDYVVGLKSPLCVDVGANVGEWTAALLERCPDAAVHAYEPQDVGPLLKRFRDDPRVLVANRAVSRKAGVGQLHGSAHPQCLRASLIAAPGLPAKAKVPVVCLDDEFDYIDVLKVDVEGAEYDVLRGADRLLLAGVRVVIFEYNDCARRARIPFADIHSFLSGCGYSCHLLGEGYPEIGPEDPEGIDGNYLAIKRRESRRTRHGGARRAGGSS